MIFPLRDETRREGVPLVTLGLIAVNLLVHIYQSTMSHERAAVFLSAVGAVPLEISSLTDLVRFPDQAPAFVPIPLTLLTAMFVHGGWLHLITNMWYLWLFGDNLEERMGPLRFVLFYVLAGLAAAMAQIAVDPRSTAPMVGASGAIAGVLGAYLLELPRARILCLVVLVVFVTFIRVPAFVVLGLWFGVQVGRGLAAGSQAGVAWFAHIGGFLTGLLLCKLFLRPAAERRDVA